MRSKKCRQSLAASAIAWLMTFAVILGMFPAMTTPVSAAEPSSGGRVSETEADYLLAGAGTSLIKIATENNLLNVNTSAYGTNGWCGGTGHMQGICVDDEVKYMYFSYTDVLAKVDIATGELVGTVTNFGPGSFGASGGAHLGCVDYYDGHIYASLEYKNPGKKFFLAIFDADEITGLNMDVNNMADNKVVNGVLLAEPTMDFRDGMVGSGLTGQDSYGEGTNEVNNGHAFACSGIDGVTMGKWPGGNDDQLYMIVAYGVYGGVAGARYDNMYNVLEFYSYDKIWQAENNGWNIPFDGSRGVSRDIGDNELLEADKTLYVFTGNTSYGSQNIEFEWDTGDIVLYTYENTDGFGKTMYVVDGSVEPTIQTLELGQNNKNSDASVQALEKSVAAWYGKNYQFKHGVANDADGYMQGYVPTLKCICGDADSHENQDDAEWGDSGVKKSEHMICSLGTTSTPTTGMHWLGNVGDDVDYFYISNGGNGTNLYKRTTAANGKMTFETVKPNLDTSAKVLAHYTMDAADLYEQDGTVYMKNTADTSGKYDAIVEGTASATGVNGGAGSALSFDATKYPNQVDRVYLNDDTISLINKEADVKLGYANYSWSFWAKLPAPEYTDGNFVPFAGFYRADGTYASVFETRWRNMLGYGICGVGSAAPGSNLGIANPSSTNPADQNTYLVYPGKDTWSSDFPGDTDWHFYTVTEDCGTVKVYVDGNCMFSKDINTGLKDKPFTSFEIGGGVEKVWQDMNNRGRFIGEIDDVTIYSGVLTADEVSAAYAAKPTDASTNPAHPGVKTEAVNNTVYAVYDLTADKGKDLTISGVTELSGLTKDTDYTVSGNSVTVKAAWLAAKECSKYTFNNGAVCLTVTDGTVPVLSYTLAKDTVSGTTVKDSSVYGVNATTTASEFDTNNGGDKNGAMVFDGYDYNEPTYVKLESTDADWLNSVLKDGYTINVWAKATAENGNKMSFLGLYAKDGRPLGALETYDTNEVTGDNGKIDGKLTVRADVGVSQDVRGTGFSQAAQSSTTVDKGTWAMYTVSYDKETGKLNLYINKNLVGSTAVTADVLGQIDQFFIGHQYQKYYYDHTGHTRDWTTRGGFYGSMSNLSVYNYALSQDEITVLYAGGSITPAQKAQPVLHWTMDADTLNENGTITETAKGYTSYWQNVTPVAGVDGKDGGAVYFDGTNNSGDYSRVWLSDSGVTGLNADVDKALTLSFWMKPDSTQTQESLPYTAAWSPVGGIFGESDNRFLMVAEYRDNQLVYSAQSGGDKRIYSSTLKDQWYYVVMTFDGEAADTALSTTNNYRRIFITGEDGVTYEYAAVNGSVGSIAANGNNATDRQLNNPGLYNNIKHVEFGGQYAKGHWTDTNVRGRYVGALDDVKIYNIAFQKADVEALYQVIPTTSAAAQTAASTQGTSVILPTTYFSADTVIFDKAAPADMTFTVEFGSSVTAVSATGLTAEDYTISGKTVTISKDWLAQQQPGEVNLAVTSSGKTNTMVLHVINNTSNDSTQPYPVLYYKMDAADLSVTTAANGNVSGTLADASGHGIDLNVGGLTTATANSSIFFDGYRDYDVSRAWLDDEGMTYLKDALKTGDVSYSFWLASDRISSNYMPVMGLYGADNRPLAVANFTTSGGERGGTGAATAPTLTAVSKGVTDYTKGDYKSSTTVSMNGFSNWHHYVMTYKADGAVVIYMDGKQIYTGTADKNQLASIDAFELGGMVNPNYYNYLNVNTMRSGVVRGRLYGNLDEVKVYNVALTQDNVTSLYNAGVSGNLPEDSTGVKVLDSIKVTAPTQTEYAVNEALNVTGGKVVVSYTDGTSKTIDLTAGMVSGFDSSKGVDSQTLTVTYTLNGVTKTDTFTVKVVKKVVAIAVTAIPKTAYEVGDALDVTGGKITVTYDDTTTAEIALTADMVSGFDSSKGGAKTLTISYTENGVTKTTNLGVSVGKRIDSIAVTTAPKTVYKVGDTLDTTGGKITLTYNDETMDEIDLLVGMVTGFDSSKGVDSQTLTVTYSDFTATYTVSIVKSLASIRVEGLISYFYVGDSLNVTGAKVVKVYDDKTEETVSLTADMVSGFDSSKGGENVVTVSCTENGVTQTAQVKLTIMTPSSGSSSSGGSSSGSSTGSSDSTVKNEDGSTTTTTTDKKTGEVTETTKDTNGVTGTTVTDKNGNVTDVSANIPASATKNDETVTLPIDEVNTKTETEIDVNVPASGATIEIPVENPTPGTVVVIVGKDGTETVIPGSKVTENGVEVTLTEDATIKVIDNSKTFSDVSDDAYFADAVAWASAREITGGVTETTFAPHASCTRAQLVTFLWRAAGQPEAESESGMTDVVPGSYYEDAVHWAAEMGIVGGYGNGLFGTNDTITRQQMAVILYRFAQTTGLDTTQGGMAIREFTDYDSISDYALTAMQWAVNAGVLQGNNGYLNPTAPCTRAQIVTMMYRLLGV